MRRTAFIVASLLVSGLFLWLALRDVPLADVAERIRQANLLWVIAAFASIVLSLWVRAVRWRGLLDFKIPLPRAFFILTITFLLNQLPLRAGEVARSLLATRSGIPVVTAATSIVLERLLDTLLVVVLLAVGLSRLPTALPAASQAAALFGMAAVVAFAILVGLARYPAFAHRLLDALESRVSFVKQLGLRGLLDNVLAGLRPLTQARSAAHAIGWTLVSWTVSLVTFYMLERALNITSVDTLLTAVLGVTLASFSIAIPVSVASIGPFESAVRLAGEAVQMNPAEATSLGFLFHGVTILSYAILGTIGLLTLGVSLSEVMGGKQDEAQAGAGR
jgi:glycosyltransferase 2 family protein